MVYDLAFRPDGGELVVGIGNRVLIYDTSDGDLINTLKVGTGPPAACCSRLEAGNGPPLSRPSIHRATRTLCTASLMQRMGSVLRQAGQTRR